MTLEMSPQDEARVAASSVAATVEETVRRVSALPDYVLDNQELLEGFALEAFEQAAAANLPPVLSEAVYRERPDLLESQSAHGVGHAPAAPAQALQEVRAHVPGPHHVPHGRRDRVVRRSAGGLSPRPVGIEEGAEVEAEVHLYETLPGTMLPDIAREESETMSAAQLHPLTKQAAGLLLGEPRMGRALMPQLKRSIGVGARLYSLAIPGKRHPHRAGIRWEAASAAARRRARHLRQHARRDPRLRVPQRSESAATGPCGCGSNRMPEVSPPRFRSTSRRGSRSCCAASEPGCLRLIHSAVTSSTAMRRLPAAAIAGDRRRLSEALVTSFAEFARTQAQRFIAAERRHGRRHHHQLHDRARRRTATDLQGAAAEWTDRRSCRRDPQGTKPDVRIEVEPGYKCE